MWNNIAHAGIISEAPSLASVGLKALNFLLSIFGIVAIISLVISGILYFTAGGDMSQIDKAKRMSLYSVVGIVITLGSIILVNQIISILG